MSAESMFLNELNNCPNMDQDEDVFKGIWNQYEGVIVRSIITSFGLDFLVGDQHGGDVDTIHNVRKIGKDPDMKYKNSQNAIDYENRGEYDTGIYHNNPTFAKIKKDAKREFDKNGTMQNDAYVPNNKVIPRNNSTIPREKQGQLDHVISAHEIHDDRGRVLAGMNGVELANNPSNLRFTNAALNLNKSDMTVDEYINWCEKNPDKVNWNGKKGEPLPDDVKQQLRKEYNRAKKEYDKKLAGKYYTSGKFVKDTAVAAGKRGAQMGLRQALGFVFTEVWFTVKEELQNMPKNHELKDMLEAVGRGIKKGFENAKSKYKEIIAKIEEGFTSGVLASLTTTICNIFFTTAKNLATCIRQIYASIVEAGKVLLFNPDNLMFGDRIKAATIVIATGASVLVGTVVGDAVSKTPIGSMPGVGEIVKTFCASFVSGMLSCTLLVFLDRSKFMNSLVVSLNCIPSEANNYKEIADAMENLAAKLANLDIDKFKKDTEMYRDLGNKIDNVSNEDDLNELLKSAYRAFNINIPWKGDFDAFMGNKDNHLVFS